MPDVSVAPVAPSTDAPAAPASGEPSPQPSSQPEFTPEQYRELQTRYADVQRTLDNANVFFNQDQEVRERLELFTRAYKEGKPYAELLQGRGATSAKPTTKNDKAPEALSEDLIRQLIQQEVTQRVGANLTPVNDQLALIQGERDAQNILKSNSWATPKDVQEFETRLTKAVNERALKDEQANYPRLSKQDALQRAWDYYARFETNDLFTSMMQDKRDAWVVSGRRPSPQLPEGAKDDISTGVDPGLDAKFKAAMKAADGDGAQIATLVKEYAPQYGVDPNDGKAVYAFYKKMVR